MKTIRPNHFLKITLLVASTLVLVASSAWATLKASIVPIPEAASLFPLCLAVAVTIFEARRRRHPQA
jgi:hypothetical protein